MKTKIITFLLSLSAILPIKAFELSDVFRVENKKDIELEGDTEDDDKKSLTLPFGAYIEDNIEVCVISYDDCPMVTLSIIDAYGNTIDTLSSTLISLQVVTFDINCYANGIYILTITTPQGTNLCGEFEVDK